MNGKELSTLLVFIDDATRRLFQVLFVQNESYFSYAKAVRGYLELHGKPIAFYSDKHGVFRVNGVNNGAGDDLTQFGWAMRELDIEIICANSPQAKGRVERANETLQDRLVKEMRLPNHAVKPPLSSVGICVARWKRKECCYGAAENTKNVAICLSLSHNKYRNNILQFSKAKKHGVP
jgi:hypothetical protein